MKAVKVSGTDTDSVSEVKQETSELYSYLSWLDPYVQPRASASNLGKVLASITSTLTRLLAIDTCSEDGTSRSETSDSGITFKVTGHVKSTKRARSSYQHGYPVDTAELQLIKSLGERLSQEEKPVEKDEEVIFGELIATQLKRIQADERTLVKWK